MAKAWAHLPAAPAELDVVVLGATGGRLDHELQNINTALCQQTPSRRAHLLGSHGWAAALPAGQHVIDVDPAHEGPTCGLMPLDGPVRATTTGLQWNLSATNARSFSFPILIRSRS